MEMYKIYNNKQPLDQYIPPDASCLVSLLDRVRPVPPLQLQLYRCDSLLRRWMCRLGPQLE